MTSNSVLALCILANNSVDRSAYGHLALEIKALLVEQEFIPRKLHRDQSRVANCLAR